MGLARAYLLENQAGLILVDAGPPGFEGVVIKKMRSLDRSDLRLIYITHAHLDHYGSAAALRRLTDAQIAVHLADAETMARAETPLGNARGRGRLVKYSLPFLERLIRLEPTTPDLELEDGDTLEGYGLDAKLVHTPGHTPGSSTLLVDGRSAFVGDLISTTGHPHVQRFYAQDWSLIATSLEHIKAREPDLIYPGHGGYPLAGRALDRLIAEYNSARVDDILEC